MYNVVLSIDGRQAINDRVRPHYLGKWVCVRDNRAEVPGNAASAER